MKRITKFFKNMNKPENEAVKDDMNEEQLNENSSAEQNDTENSSENSNVGNPGDKDGKIMELEARVAELNDKHLRLYSEFDNFRKRNARERVDLIKTAGEDIFKAILSTIDDFERAIKANETTSDIKTVNEGIQLIYAKMKNSFTQKGLEAMESIGKEFNSDIMEAITHIPAPSEDLKGKVVDEVEKGYILNGKVIRYAKVIVGS